MQYRNELKYVVTAADRASVCANMRYVASIDEHAAPDGKYTIRSLYFDSPDDRALRDKADGVNEREKFRIRMYNSDDAFIRLEKKIKRDGLGCKISCELTKTEVLRILSGDVSWIPSCGRALAVELYAKMKTQLLRPKVIVEYERIPFVYAPGNVRVTIDYNIRTGLCCKDFLKPDCVTIPAPDAPILLEIKWDGYLPNVIRDSVALKGRRNGAFSKYGACRIYG